MEITICITRQDILCNPNIFDEIKVFGQMVAGTKNEADFKGQPKKTGTKSSIITLWDVRKALGDLSKEKGSVAAKNILKTFNVDRATELLEKDYISVMDAVKQVQL